MSLRQEVKVEEDGWEVVSNEAVRESAFAVALGLATTAAWCALHGALFWLGGPFWLHGAIWWSLWGQPRRALSNMFWSLRWRLVRLLWRRGAAGQPRAIQQ